jgi:archaellin
VKLNNLLYKYSYDIATKFALESSVELRNRSKSRSIVNELGQESASASTVTSSVLKRMLSKGNNMADSVASALTAGISYVDQKTSTAVWHGAYKKEMARLSKESNSSKNHDMAVKKADEVVRKTQPKFENKDVVGMARNKWMSFFRPFASAITQNVNVLTDALHPMSGLSKTERVGIMAMLAVEAYGIALIDEARRNLSFWSDDEDKTFAEEKSHIKRGVADSEFNLTSEEYTRTVFGSFANAIPFGSSMVNVVLDKYYDAGYFDKMNHRQLAFDPLGVVKTFTDSVTGEDDSGKAAKSALAMLGIGYNNLEKQGRQLKAFIRMIDTNIKNEDPNSKYGRKLRFAKAELEKLKRANKRKK